MARMLGWMLAGAVAAGCAVAGVEAGEDVDPVAPAAPNQGTADAGSAPSLGPSPTTPRPATVVDAGTMDASRGDAGAPKDASLPSTDASTSVSEAGPIVVDAGTSFAPVGSPCVRDGEVQATSCALCGTSRRACVADASGKLVWQAWGACVDQVVGGCEPGETSTETCGRCGTRPRVCDATCTYSRGFCTEPVGAACVAGDLDFTEGVSCESGGRSRSCNATCNWGAFSPTCESEPMALVISPTDGARVSQARSFVRERTVKSLNSYFDCSGLPVPADAGAEGGARPWQPSPFATRVTAYDDLVLVNPTDKVAVVSVWSAKAEDSGPNVQTLMAWYDRPEPPKTDADRASCQKRVTSSCDDVAKDPSACQTGWAGLTRSGTNKNDDRVVIPARGSVIVHTAAQELPEGARNRPGLGRFRIVVRTDGFQLAQ
ncbi:MAG: hypothetical protein U0169_08110 [Polyangiaceae bacterium]